MTLDATPQLLDLDFADFTVLVLSNYEYIQNMTDRVVNTAGREGLELNAVKSDQNNCTERSPSKDWKRRSGRCRRVCLSQL